MKCPEVKSNENRRQFLSKLIPAGVMACMCCPKMLSAAQAQPAKETMSDDGLYLERSEMSYEAIFNFAFRDHLIPILQELSKHYSKDEFLKIMKDVASNAFSRKDVMDKSNKNLNQVFWSHVIEREVVEDSVQAFELKITKCLWEKVYREAGAAELGYAVVCNTDFATAKASDQQLIRSKTLMQGHDCCNHRWIYKT